MITNTMLKIKIFGSHCRRCQLFKEFVHNIVQELHVNAQITCSKSPEDFIHFNVLYLPALAVNEKLLFQGGFPSVKNLKKLIASELNQSIKD